ncbi:hypothetical protein KSF_058560 [Reticulibacter mediterranei]|uniref:Uncharacterized protein n=1 Tax=Reticulibacter mediterranei TaxID=2778369 RepID=A0A8J3IL29_9CHLR|nr:hypothetical protein [Reticulibacter mediterranei]GHO95808.1 hypothetical protein KSF_058560 [Reticulibacter mediterranei]
MAIPGHLLTIADGGQVRWVLSTCRDIEISGILIVTDYDAQPYWAHRKRDVNRLSPAEVLGEA